MNRPLLVPQSATVWPTAARRPPSLMLVLHLDYPLSRPASL